MSSKDISTHATYGKEVDIRKYPKIPGGWRRYEYVDSITQTLLALFEELLWRRDFEAASEVLTVLMTQTKAIPDVIFKVINHVLPVSIVTTFRLGGRDYH